MEIPSHDDRKNPEIVGEFISLVADLLKTDMTQADYDHVREIAGVLNPGGGYFGFVGRLNRDIAARFPAIETRD